MTPKEKAQELAMKFDKYGETDNAKQCALIAVDEILDAICFNMYDEDAHKKENDYWKEVKEQLLIEKSK